MILKPFVSFFISCVFIFLQETNGNGTHGTPGVDYPNYSEIPSTTFHCQNQENGFYPDFETRCQVFHYCGEDGHETFICPIGTIFNELVQSCDQWFNSECRVPPSYEYDGVYQSRTDYGTDGPDVFDSSRGLYDKMASLYSRSPYETGMGYGNAEHSEYGSSSYGTSSQYNNEELAGGISNGALDSPLKHGGLENNGPVDYKSIGEHITEHEAIVGDMYTENDHSTSDINSGYHQSSGVSHFDHANHPSQETLYYRKPAVYHYDTERKEHGDVFYGEDSDSQGAGVHVYGKDAEYDDSEEDEGGDSGEGAVLQKRISEYRRRQRPKPVVSYVESDLEIVTLPPQKAKRPRMPLVVENTEQSVTEPMTTTTENIMDVRASELEGLADAVAVDPSGDLSSSIEEKESQTYTGLQSERKEDKVDFGVWVTEESSGDDKYHDSEQPDSSKFQNSEEEYHYSDQMDSSKFQNANDDDDNNGNDSEETDSSASESVIEDLYNKMTPNLFYVDPNEQYYGDETSSSHDVLTDEAFDVDLDSSKFQNANADDENNRNELEETDSTASQSVIGDVYNKMRPNLLYVDPNEQYYGDETSSSHDVLTDEAFDDIYSINHGINANDYGNGPLSTDEEDQFGKYADDGELETEVADESEIQKNIGDFATEKNEYDFENDESEDNAEMFQEVVGPEGKIYLKFGDEIIDPAEYFPEWSEESPGMEEILHGDDFQEANEADEKYSVDTSNPSEYHSQYSDSDSKETDENLMTSPKTSEEKYLTDDLKEVSYGPENSVHDSVENLAEMYHQRSDVYDSSLGYDVLDTQGIYVDEGSGDADDTLSSDFEYSNVPLYADPVYFEGGVNSEEQDVLGEGTGEGKDMTVSEGIDASSTPSDYHYTMDYTQFVTDQPDIGVSSTAMLEYASNADNQMQQFPFEMHQFDGLESDLEFQEFFQTDSNHFSQMDAATEQGTSTTTKMDPALELNSDVDSESISGWSDVSKSLETEAFSSTLQGTSSTEATPLEQALELKDLDVNSESMNGSSDNTTNSKVEVVSSTEEGTITTEENKMGQGKDLNNSGSKSKSNRELLSSLLSFLDVPPNFGGNETVHSNSSKSHKNDTNFENDRKSHPKESKFLKALGVRNLPDSSREEVDLSSDISPFKKGSPSPSDEESPVRSDLKTNFQASSSQKKPRSSSIELGVTDEQLGEKQTGRTGRNLPGSKLAKMISFVKKLLTAKKKAKSNIIKRIIPSAEWDDYEVKV